MFAGGRAAEGRASGCTHLPATIQIDGLFDEVVDDLLADSPTFRRQCERIVGRPLVRVSVRTLPRKEESCCRARTTMRRYASGALIAWVEIPSPRTRLEYAELLGHEFEHILEQIDGVDLRAQSARPAGATLLADGAYETVRAQRAGEIVAMEAALKGSTSAETHRLR
jgi:hypothetical protein